MTAHSPSASSLPFGDRLAEAVARAKTPLVVGLDPRRESLPAPLAVAADAPTEEIAEAYRRFCLAVVDEAAGAVPAVKPQIAFFEQLGPPGLIVLQDIMQAAQERGLLVILDAKRGDIGSTAEGYAEAYLAANRPWACDALTVNPFLGDDTLKPMVDACRSAVSTGLFVLVRTSNPGGGFIQEISEQGQSVTDRVAAWVETTNQAQVGASGYGHVGAVVGATRPDELARLRKQMPSAWLLVPGLGAQGGAAADVAGGFDNKGHGALINSSRAIIFAYKRADLAARFPGDAWPKAVRASIDETVAALAEATPAGVLRR